MSTSTSSSTSTLAADPEPTSLTTSSSLKSPTFQSLANNNNDNNNTSPRVALVTGAAQGIGRGIALRLAKEGYKVAICDLPGQKEKLEEVEREISTLSEGREPLVEEGEKVNENQSGNMDEEETGEESRKRVVAILADVSKEEDVRAMVQKCVAELGSLDVMVANAGTAIYKPLLELPVEEFDKVISVNLRGAMLCYKYAAAQMVKQGKGGRIIGASSLYGKAGAPNLAGYCASKFGIRGLTHTAALEWGKYGITVNAYAPAAIRTPMLESYDDQLTSTMDGMKQGDFLEQIRMRSPLGYLGGPTEVASLVAYLASPEAHFITGQTLSVNGGSLVD